MSRNYRSSPKLGRTVEALLDQVARCERAGDERLPTSRQLAGKLGVSVNTVTKALRELCQRQLISTAPGRGIRLSTSRQAPLSHSIHTAPAPDEPTAVPRWMYLQNRITDDILRGAFPPGTLLPSYKELTSRYETSFSTLRIALASLLSNGRIVPHKKGFRVYQIAQRRNRPLLMVIAKGKAADELFALSSLSREFWPVLEWECNRLGIEIELYTAADVLGSAEDPVGHKRFLGRRKSRTIAGFFVWLYELSLDELSMVCSRLSETGKPVSVLGEVESAGIPRLVATNRLFKVFSVTFSTAPGRVVGDYLIGSGHRRVACFSPFGKIEWSRNRINGIDETFRAAGLNNAVVEFTAEGVDRFFSLWARVPGAQPWESMDGHFREIARLANPDVDPSDHSLYYNSILTIWRHMLDPIMIPLFDRALQDKNITAWIGINDEVAAAALRFLRARNIRVPRELSVVGFDDAPESIARGLTSYNFNVSAVVRAMLDHVLDKRMTRALGLTAPVEIPGVVMERASSGVAPKAVLR